MVQVKEIHALVGHEHCRANWLFATPSALNRSMILIYAGHQGCPASALASRTFAFDEGVSAGPSVGIELLRVSSAGAERL